MPPDPVTGRLDGTPPTVPADGSWHDQAMNPALEQLVVDCQAVAGGPDSQEEVQAVLAVAVKRPEVGEAVAGYEGIQSLEDLAFHRSTSLTLLAAALPPGFSAAPHNHDLWSVVGVCRGREDNQFFERDGQGLKEVGEASVVGPGVLANDPEVIHAIHNPLDTPLLALHAYGGDLLSTPRSNWDPETREEIPFDWEKVSSETQE